MVADENKRKRFNSCFNPSAEVFSLPSQKEESPILVYLALKCKDITLDFKKTHAYLHSKNFLLHASV